MKTRVIALFQKLKWTFLGISKPYYYVWSDKNEQDEIKFDLSGKKDVDTFIIKDRTLVKLLDFKKSNLLEIGCGVGRMTKYLGKYFNKVYAVDISKPMIDLAKQRLRKTRNVKFYVTDGQSLLIKDNSIDFVFSYIVFQHFPSKLMVENNLKEIYRVLKRNGLAKIQFRANPAYGGFLRYFKWYYGVNYDKNELINSLRMLGFEVVATKQRDHRELWVVFSKS